MFCPSSLAASSSHSATQSRLSFAAYTSRFWISNNRSERDALYSLTLQQSSDAQVFLGAQDCKSGVHPGQKLLAKECHGYPRIGAINAFRKPSDKTSSPFHARILRRMSFSFVAYCLSLRSLYSIGRSQDLGEPKATCACSCEPKSNWLLIGIFFARARSVARWHRKRTGP